MQPVEPISSYAQNHHLFLSLLETRRCANFASCPADFLACLDALVERRALERPAGSYTTNLFEAGVRRIAQKVGEEGVETALAAVAQDDAALLGESADLLYHLTVLLHARGLSLADAVEMLRADLENERVTINSYRERVKQCEALEEFAMAEHIREILIQEQEHLIDLSTALGENPPDVGRGSKK